MKILHITDSHATMKAPESRIDIYYLAFLKKMYELKYVINANDIKMVIHTGDMFHTPRVSDKFTGQIAEIIKSWKVPVYVIPGNHDIDGYNVNTIDQTKLGLLYKTGIVRELDRSHPLKIKVTDNGVPIVINIAGQEYYSDIDTGNLSDFEMQINNSADFNILGIHGYVCKTPQNSNINYTLCKDVVTDADVILSGHFHESFEYHDKTGLNIYNPGSMMRVERNVYNKTHMPQYGILEINKDANGNVSHNYTFHQFKIAESSDKVFDYTLAASQKQNMITISNFKNSVSNASNSNNMYIDTADIVKNIATNTLDMHMAQDQDCFNSVLSTYNKAKATIDCNDTFIKNGYIQNTTEKHITSVEIHNFQSHEDTKINFADGLNVIVGESNSGKTSILRAIRWCLDNDPSGNAFITTGQTECSVKIGFSDGTFIERKRTKSSAGEYNVRDIITEPDGTTSYYDTSFKGFGSNVPIQIDNIHQMPKINIGNDSIHLNVINQLDAPFLISESPQNRAAIIGKLTGTDIIDCAIKDTANTIRADKTAIKKFQSFNEEYSYKLDKYKFIPDFEKMINYLKSIYLELEFRRVQIEKSYTLLADYVNKSTAKDYVESTLTHKETDIQIYNTIIAMYESIKNKQYVKSLYDEVVAREQKYNALEKTYNSLTTFISMESLINKYDAYKKTIDKTKELYDNVIRCKAVYESTDSKLKGMNSTLSVEPYINGISDYIHNCVNVINTASKYCANVENINNNILELTNSLSSIDSNVNTLSCQLNDLRKEARKNILSKGVCPCCGQPITEDNIEHVEMYMEENGENNV